MPTTTLKPGEFAGTCSRPRWVTLSECVDLGVDPDTTSQRWDGYHLRTEFRVWCNLTSTDAAAYTEHTNTAHHGGLYRWDSAIADVLVANPTGRKYPGPYSPTRTVKSKSDAGLGTPILWVEGDLSRGGRVWCLGPAPRSVWVVPDHPTVSDHPAAPGWRKREQAVLLSLRHAEPVVIDRVEITEQVPA
jgi:hypothetical protein